MLKKIISRPLLLILLLAIFLRLYHLPSNPPHLNWDEVSMGYTAYSLLHTGKDEWGQKLPIFFRSYGEWKSALYIYVLVPFIKIFGLNAWAVRLPSALAGIVAVYLTYLLGKLIYSPSAGLWSAFFLALSPWHLMLSRPAFEANLSLTLVLAGLYFFLKYFSLQSRSPHYLFVSSLFFGLAPHTYNSAKVVVPLLIFYLFFLFRSRLKLSHLLLPGFILAIFALPILLNIFTGRAQYRYSQVGITTDSYHLNQFYNYRHTFPLPSSLNKLLFNKYTFFVYHFTDNWLSYFSPHFLLLEGGDHNQHSLPYRGVLYISEFFLFLYGLSRLKKQSHPAKYLPLALIALGFIPPATTRESYHVLRSILTLPGWQLVAGLGIASFWPYLATHKKLLFAFTTFFAIEVVTFLFMYFAWYPQAFGRDWQWGYRQVAAYLRQHQSQYAHIVMTKWYGEPQLFLAFYNHWDPRWYQLHNRLNLRYAQEGKIWLDQLPTYSLGKYTFKYIDWPNEKKDNTLFIGKFDDFPYGAKILKTIRFPDGQVAFHIAVAQ